MKIAQKEILQNNSITKLVKIKFVQNFIWLFKLGVLLAVLIYKYFQENENLHQI